MLSQTIVSQRVFCGVLIMYDGVRVRNQSQVKRANSLYPRSFQFKTIPDKHILVFLVNIPKFRGSSFLQPYS